MIDDGSRLLTDPKEVAEVMNEHYTSVAMDIGTDTHAPSTDSYENCKDFTAASIDYHKSHPSIIGISQKAQSFSFTHTSEIKVRNAMKKLNIKKATGYDQIPAKALVAGYDLLAPSFMRLFNKCVDMASFPSDAKLAEVSPIYKKNNALEKKNHRPVSILTSSSKVLERLMDDQMNQNWLPSIFDDYLAAFRPRYGCQHVLLGLCDDWRYAREHRQIPAILLVDLSKAFDCLPHSLVVAKANAYGMDKHSSTFLADYLSQRHQRVKLGGQVSSWITIPKGVPQGSIIGPTVFNIFINDVFSAIHQGKLYNYADDNTILVQAPTTEEVMHKICDSATDVLSWCNRNQMEANASKFQVMLPDGHGREITIDNNSIVCEDSVKLLGVHLDGNLNFNVHISHLARKATRQLNCLKRVAYKLPEEIKLLLYKSFVMSNLNYCPAVWHLCGRQNTKKLEKIQFRALKFVFGDYQASYSDLLKRSNLPTLELSRLRTIAVEVFKAYRNLSPRFISDKFQVHSTGYNLRRSSTISRHHRRTTNFGLHTFEHYGATLWNNLPQSLRDVTELQTFRTLVKSWTGPNCTCSFCS